MADWRPIETLSEVPPLEQVLVWKPGGKVQAMKAVLALRAEKRLTHWMPTPEPPLGLTRGPATYPDRKAAAERRRLGTLPG